MISFFASFFDSFSANLLASLLLVLILLYVSFRDYCIFFANSVSEPFCDPFVLSLLLSIIFFISERIHMLSLEESILFHREEINPHVEGISPRVPT